MFMILSKKRSYVFCQRLWFSFLKSSHILSHAKLYRSLAPVMKLYYACVRLLYQVSHLQSNLHQLSIHSHRDLILYQLEMFSLALFYVQSRTSEHDNQFPQFLNVRNPMEIRYPSLSLGYFEKGNLSDIIDQRFLGAGKAAMDSYHTLERLTLACVLMQSASSFLSLTKVQDLVNESDNVN